MKLVIFGLSVSSSWGNGHATLWRGILRALAGLGHQVVFFERDVPYYANHRDLWELPGGELLLYGGWDEVLPAARRHLAQADAAMVTSFCPDGLVAAELVLGSRVPCRCFYDLDTPVTLQNLAAGAPVPYLPPQGLGGFDLVLSYTGGAALDELRRRLGARRVAPLYGSVDPRAHRPAPPRPEFTGDLSHLGTYSADRFEPLRELLLAPAARLPGRTFVIGGSMYPAAFPWTANIRYIPHVPPQDHPAFYCSSPLTLNVTREPMAAMGYCPSGRLFESAACGVPVLSDAWDGLDAFFAPGSEILVARTADEAIAALTLPPERLAEIGRAARARALAEHTAEHRARELLDLLGADAAARGGQRGAA
ncbi:MAG: glycosyltransferase [Acidobacteria bacterium]|nr:glycosyltransferase [Acidobacteriota bacterium]